MKKGDFIWALGIVAVAAFLLIPATNHIFETMTTAHPYIMGFIKFAILATMGELLAIRLAAGDYRQPAGLFWRIIIWGFIGMLVTLMFNVFAAGVSAAMQQNLLPFHGVALAFAFFTSTIMNCFFAPSFMSFHKYTDTYLDLRANRAAKVTFADVTAAIDWHKFYGFVILKTIPFFWIPAHTVTFMLPAEYRVIAAAFLSVALGMILSLANRKTA